MTELISSNQFGLKVFEDLVICHSVLDGRWADAGTIESYHETNRLIYEAEKE